MAGRSTGFIGAGRIPHHRGRAKAGLDAFCRRRHSRVMSDRDAEPSARKEPASEREQRLAEALRANLRRRKKPAKDPQKKPDAGPQSP